MRVALLYSGLPRLWRECHETQLKLFPDAEVDVFFHFWDTVDAAEKQAIIDTMRPVAHAFQPLGDYRFIDDYPNLRTDAINVPSRLVSQYISWRQVATLFQPHAAPYDLAIRSRTDLYFFNPIAYDLNLVAFGNVALVAFHWPEDRQLLSDMFAIGKPRATLYFHSLIDDLWTYAVNGTFNAESLITRHLLAVPAAPGAFVMYTIPESPFFVFRPHMRGWPLERCLAEGAGVSKWRDPEVLDAHQRYHETRHGDDGPAYVRRFAADQFTLAAPNTAEPTDPAARNPRLSDQERG